MFSIRFLLVILNKGSIFCVVKHENNRKLVDFFKDNKIDFRRITK